MPRHFLFQKKMKINGKASSEAFGIKLIQNEETVLKKQLKKLNWTETTCE